MTKKKLSEHLELALAHLRAEEPFIYDYVTEKALSYTSAKECDVLALNYDAKMTGMIVDVIMTQYAHGYGNIIDHSQMPTDQDFQPDQEPDAVLPQLMNEYKNQRLDMTMLDFLRDTMAYGRKELGDDDISRQTRLFAGRAFIDGMLDGKTDDESGLARHLASLEPRHIMTDQLYTRSIENFTEVMRLELKPVFAFLDEVKHLTCLEPNTLLRQASQRALTLMRSTRESPSGMAFAENMSVQQDLISEFMITYVFSVLDIMDNPITYQMNHTKLLFERVPQTYAQDALDGFTQGVKEFHLDTSAHANACAVYLMTEEALHDPENPPSEAMAFAMACAIDDVTAMKAHIPVAIRDAWDKNVIEALEAA